MTGQGVRRLARLLAPEARGLGVAAVCMLALAGTTALAAALVGPAVQALLTGSAAGGLAAKLLPRSVLRSPDGLPVVIVAIAAVKGLAYFGQFHLMALAGQRTASRLRRELLAALLRAEPEMLGRHQTGEFLSRFAGDATAVEMAVTYALAGYLRDTATAALLFAVCLWVDWRLSLIACAALPLTLVPLARMLKSLRRRLADSARSQGALGHLVAEGLQGLPSIQVDGLAEREAAR
ncbi:MAG TPA: ABC transporter transmembrane domain-containing protein, partial [Myxococcales bacterium]|nr:ABC transporter transmembrane domain-containing protein [Myxococcales bacterium]